MSPRRPSRAPRLGVNIDHVATLRQQRQEGVPDLVAAARCVERAGADSIVVHLREDRRHIQDADLFALKKALRIDLAMEMAATDEMVRIACRLKPSRVCLVPEKRRELTTEGGLNAAGLGRRLARQVSRLKAAAVPVSLFIDPVPQQVMAAARLGVEMVELHTGAYARRRAASRREPLRALRRAADFARSLGLELHAGHGLDYANVRPIARLPGMSELNIGFAIISRALWQGLDRAVREMKRSF